MKVSDLMTTAVFTLRLDKQVFIAQQIMDWAHIRHVPVVDHLGRVVGLVSHRDILRASVSTVSSKVAKLEQRQHLAGIAVREIMQAKVRTISPDTSVQEAAKLMLKEKIGCLPVVNAEQELLGVITEHDMLRLVEHLPEGLNPGGAKALSGALKKHAAVRKS
jgi:CBS domain-containing protein